MWNLVALRHAARRLTALHDASTQPTPTAMAVNLVEMRLYVLHPRGRIESVSIEEDDDVEATLVDLNQVVLTDDEHVWQWIDYVAELDALVCGSTGGALAVVDLSTRETEEIGSMDRGIVGMAWSSNQEALAVVTGVGTLLVMNTAWEVLQETHLQAVLSSDVTLALEQKPQVNIHWREDGQYIALNLPTQVQGKADAPIVQKVVVLTNELGLHALGRLEDGRAIPHLGASLDWCPNHSLIASHETRKDQLWIVFFERNGLRHGEFALPSEYRSSSTRVRGLQWNTKSDILAVHLESDTTSRLLLWTRNNYHWYLKQEVAFELRHKRLEAFAWDEERANLLHLLTADSQHSGQWSVDEAEFVWDTSRGERLEDGRSVVVCGVIDGANLLLTPLNQALVPPPMALHTIFFATTVNSVAFDNNRDMLVVALANGDIVVVENALSGEEDEEKRKTYTVHSDTSVTAVVSMQLSDKSTQRATIVLKTGVDDALTMLTVPLQDKSEGDADAQMLIPLEELEGVRRVVDIAQLASTMSTEVPSVAVQTRDGSVYGLHFSDTANGDEVRVTRIADALQPFDRFQVVQHDEATHFTIGLSSKQKLFVNETPVSTAPCSSFHFCVTSSVLLYTTLGSSAQLRFLPLASLMQKSFAETETETRVIERGARLVAVIGDRASVILQMPRGNLEGVAPRLLVLSLTVKHIQRYEYVQALEMCRRHRLDLNLLVDYDIEGFLTNFDEHLIKNFLAARPHAITSDRLCLFITNLHIVDVWSTKYRPLLQPFLSTQEPEATAVSAGEDKVNRVCQAMMHVVSETKEIDQALLLPYLTSAVKQSPPDYVAALHKVQQFVQTQEAASAKRAMKHLIFLTQVDVLFDEALALYDLPLVRFIATYSQRDPKEYVPFLDEMAAITDDTVRQYRIDLHLKRYARALEHASVLLQRHDGDGDAHGEVYEKQVAEIVERSALFDQALTLFPAQISTVRGKRIHQRVLQLKATHLLTQERFQEAGFVLMTIGSFAEAMQAFKSARAWEMALIAANRASISRGELSSFAYDLAQALLNQKEVSQADLLAAARIYVEYCEDLDEAVALLVKHKHWDESVRLAYLHQRADLIETDIEPGVHAAADAVLDDLKQRESEYVKHWTRLATIREQKRLFKLHGIDGSRWEGGHGGDDSQSVISGATSVADSALSTASSLRSVGSHNSSVSIGNFAIKNLAAATSSHFYATQSLGGMDAAMIAASKSKRYNGMPSRKERRRRIKEGSVEEEVHVSQQIKANSLNASLQREVRDLLRVLVLFGHGVKAEELQTRLQAFEKLVTVDYPLPTLAESTPVIEGDNAEPQSTQETTEDVAWRFPAFAS
ncbi:hypothetical protein Poli38472_012851 [Pythium oligandrum]|uniref:Elongator complex protein 1 n=1 Tax=Pythium oligandrum TaxID=41045 RepID=A0A8K1FKI4_PYTOL|nr:hypothetical protein Poli38472_012851 [Pythium oligandrum]|eukprot:TMW64229.1 hypothetical protein Poli38472_012851 [Pythium oligandrum]